MTRDFPHEFLQDAEELSAYQGWTEEVYRDFFALRSGAMSEETFDRKYRRQRAVLVLDTTGFTASAMYVGEIASLLRVVDVQGICIPVLKSFDAELIRCFADNLVAVFTEAGAAVDAAFEIHERVRQFVSLGPPTEHPAYCCIGIGWGGLFAIGPNLAQGDEMNRAAKLGEDIARGNETLLTERAFGALEHRDDVHCERLRRDDQLFPYYRVTPAPG